MLAPEYCFAAYLHGGASFEILPPLFAEEDDEVDSEACARVGATPAQMNQDR
jgi:hypothetical protein